MSKDPILTNYVSEIDQLLQNFTKEHTELSASQKKEKAKHDRIYKLRDSVERQTESTQLWEKF
ncbi:MAG: hypothetical protein P4M12_00410 [Gammaproteobacteria bacterium]|nr:hypothetical protein [Gammaproteobacteria bacterium]